MSEGSHDNYTHLSAPCRTEKALLLPASCLHLDGIISTSLHHHAFFVPLLACARQAFFHNTNF